MCVVFICDMKGDQRTVLFLHFQCPPQSFLIVESRSWKHLIQVNHFRSWWNTVEQEYWHPSFLQLQLQTFSHKEPYDWCPHSSQITKFTEAVVSWSQFWITITGTNATIFSLTHGNYTVTYWANSPQSQSAHFLLSETWSLKWGLGCKGQPHMLLIRAGEDWWEE